MANSSQVPKPSCVLVTGASRGIGFAIAKQMAVTGYRLFLTSKNTSRLLEAQRQLQKLSAFPVDCLAVDLSQKNAADTIYDFVRSRQICLSVLVNNAGFGTSGGLDSLDRRALDDLMQVNIQALSQLCFLFSRDMKAQRSGHIMNVSSVLAFYPLPLLAAYSASKAFVLNFSQALRYELAPYNVWVSCLIPGATRTQFFEKAGLFEPSSWLMSCADKVAAFAFRGFQARRFLIHTGFRNRFLVWILDHLPHGLLRFLR